MKAGAHVIDRQIVPARQNEMEFFGLQKDALLLHIKRVRTATVSPSLRRTSLCRLTPTVSC